MGLICHGHLADSTVCVCVCVGGEGMGGCQWDGEGVTEGTDRWPLLWYVNHPSILTTTPSQSNPLLVAWALLCVPAVVVRHGRLGQRSGGQGRGWLG